MVVSPPLHLLPDVIDLAAFQSPSLVPAKI
jgi:hypothetical protein